ncbi:MAG TPA: hypothetical protein VIL74_19260 [Pyrinomonadaceae bacterium]
MEKGRSMKNEAGRKITQGLTYLFVALGVAASVGGVLFLPGAARFATPVAAQQDPFLSQRLSQIESAVSRVETRLNRLESESRLSAIAPRAADRDETAVRLLQSQLDVLQSRLAAIECGLVKLDERTLSAAARQARKNSAPLGDRCRLDAGAPLQIVARP